VHNWTARDTPGACRDAEPFRDPPAPRRGSGGEAAFKVAAVDADGEAGHTRSGDGSKVTIETAVDGGGRDPTTRRRIAGGTDERMGDLSMVMWPALTLIGFVLLTGLVVAMGMSSTARYEREQRTAPAGRNRQPAADPVGAVPA
jgi:hypothetical protein